MRAGECRFQVLEEDITAYGAPADLPNSVVSASSAKAHGRRHASPFPADPVLFSPIKAHLMDVRFRTVVCFQSRDRQVFAYGAAPSLDPHPTHVGGASSLRDPAGGVKDPSLQNEKQVVTGIPDLSE